MKTEHEIERELLAPCGMDCSTCSQYLAYINGIPKKRGRISHCTGCRPRNKLCAYLKGQCELLSANKIDFCFECSRYPCERLRHLDRRYRITYGVSPIQNLEDIRARGVDSFLRQQRKVQGCPNCDGMISIHNKKCFACDKIGRWNG